MQAATPGQQKYVTISDAAKFCSISERSIRRLVASKKLTAYRLMPGSIRIDIDELREYAQSTADKSRTRGRNLQLAC